MRRAGAQRLVDARRQLGGGQPLLERVPGRGGFFRRADQVGHRAVHRAHLAVGIHHHQAGRHAVDHLFQVVAVLAHIALVGMGIGVQRQPHVEADHLQHRIPGLDEARRIVVQLLPQQAGQFREVFAVGADIPFRVEPDALVGGAHAQALVDVGRAVVAGRQAAEVAGLCAPQARGGFAVGQQLAQAREGQQVRIKTVREGVALLVQQGVHLAQDGGVALVELQKTAARRDFFVVQANLSCEGVDHFPGFPHAILRACKNRTDLAVPLLIWVIMGNASGQSS